MFGVDGLEHQGIAALEGLKQFMIVGTDSVHYVVVRRLDPPASELLR